MGDIHIAKGSKPETLGMLLKTITPPFRSGDTIGVKIHWGERGNRSFLKPAFTREIVAWLQESGMSPFVFDTTVLYSGGRRTGRESLKTAVDHGFTESYLGCPILIADGMDGRDVIEISADYTHFTSVQVARIINKTDGFVIFSHFKGHLESCFGGAIKNLSMGFASRAQKQRMHADAHPILIPEKCNRCGVCSEVCPVGAAVLPSESGPVYDLKKCVGCSQCIALCPQAALKIFWETDVNAFMEKLVETAAAVWKEIGNRTLVINALIQMVSECDCLPGKHPMIAEDVGFIAGNHPLTVDESSLLQAGAEAFERAHPGLNWKRQFEHARRIGFTP